MGKKFFDYKDIDENDLCQNHHIIKGDTTLRSFQYKILNNILFLNKKLYTFGVTNTALCSLCSSLKKLL